MVRNFAALFSNLPCNNLKDFHVEVGVCVCIYMIQIYGAYVLHFLN